METHPAPVGVTATEVGRNLVITTDFGDYVVPPLSARVGGTLLQTFIGVSFGNGALPSPDEQENMFVMALGQELYDRVQDELRLPEVVPICLIALYWQTIGMEAVNAYLAGGVGKALEVLISRTGLSLQTTSSSLAAAVTTPSPAATKGMSTRSGGATA